MPHHHLFELVYPQERFDVDELTRQIQQVVAAASALRDEGCGSALSVVAFCEQETEDRIELLRGQDGGRLLIETRYRSADHPAIIGIEFEASGS